MKVNAATNDVADQKVTKKKWLWLGQAAPTSGPEPPSVSRDLTNLRVLEN